MLQKSILKFIFVDKIEVKNGMTINMLCFDLWRQNPSEFNRPGTKKVTYGGNFVAHSTTTTHDTQRCDTNKLNSEHWAGSLIIQAYFQRKI